MKVNPFSVDKIWIPTEFSKSGSKKEDYVNLAGCENCKTSYNALEAIRTSTPDLLIDHWESQDITLREKLADIHKVSKEQVYLTSGAIGGIRYAFDVFTTKDTRVGLLQPDFPGFVYFAERAQTKIKTYKKNDFPFYANTKDITAFLQKEKIDFVPLSNPNAATGVLRESKEIEELLTSNPGTFFVVDEADSIYPDLSSAYLSRNCNNALWLGSFSKFYGLSGLRIGYLITPPRYTSHFENTINPAELTSQSIMAATFALEDSTYQKDTQERVKINLAQLETVCKGTKYQIIPGSMCFASYLWSEHGEDPYEELRKHGIKIAEGKRFGIDRGGRINLSNPDCITKVTEVLHRLS